MHIGAFCEQLNYDENQVLDMLFWDDQIIKKKSRSVVGFSSAHIALTFFGKKLGLVMSI